MAPDRKTAVAMMHTGNLGVQTRPSGKHSCGRWQRIPVNLAMLRQRNWT